MALVTNIDPAKLARVTASTAPPYRCLECQHVADTPAGIRMHFTRRHGSMTGSPGRGGIGPANHEPGEIVDTRRPVPPPAAPPANGPAKAIPHHKFFPLAKIDAIATEFLDLWEKDRAMPLTGKTVLPIANRILGRKFHSLNGEVPQLAARIDDLARARFQAIPPLLGAAGRVICRHSDGTPKSPAGRVPTPRQAAAADTPAGNGSGYHPPRAMMRWSDAEKDLLHEMIMELVEKDPVHGISLAIVKTAMHKIIEQPRWRDLTGRANAADVFERAEKAFAAIVARGFHPPEPVEVEKAVRVPVDLGRVLADVPLARLAAVLAGREMELREAFYTNRPAPAPAANAALIAGGADEESVAALLPRILVVGFRPNQHAQLEKDWLGKPVVLLKSIDPSTPIDKTVHPPILKLATRVLVDNYAAPAAWRDFVIACVPVERREGLSGSSRVFHHVREIVNQWERDNPAAFKVWQNQRARP